MKVEIITLNLLGRRLSHATSSGASTKEFDKKIDLQIKALGVFKRCCLRFYLYIFLF